MLAVNHTTQGVNFHCSVNITRHGHRYWGEAMLCCIVLGYACLALLPLASPRLASPSLTINTTQHSPQP